MAKYEAHITFDKKYAGRLKLGVGTWQYSAIDDDPLMGQKPYCYLTAYNTNPYDLQTSMFVTVQILLDEGIEALRTKIERIIYDSKTNHDELGPALENPISRA